MKIVSSYKDYYDSLMDPSDRDRIFLCSTRPADAAQSALLARIQADHPRKAVAVRYQREAGPEWGWLVPRILVFCGQVYPAWQLEETLTGNYARWRRTAPKLPAALIALDGTVVWTPEQLDSLLEKLHRLDTVLRLGTRLGFELGWHSRAERTAEPRAGLADWLASGSARHLPELVMAGITSSWIPAQEDTRRHQTRKTVFTLNPELREIQFYKRLDPQTAYQELERYLFDVMTESRLPMAALSDREQVQRKGFDAQYGFRTRPHG
ncbi:hypothetical protein [Thiomonas sp.]